ncbi:hypothetical protein AB0N99_30935 [Streptomyces sp. NPDC093272]|uniref:hypothetical protein n=1 Tax=Streptomyces sp. NPDC093272 TaxID=3154981 RepID=UPI003431F0F7
MAATPTDLTIRLARELHRRQARYDSRPRGWTKLIRTQVDGELLGLRVALGMALGHEAASGNVVPAAWDFYLQWLDAGMPEVMP